MARPGSVKVHSYHLHAASYKGHAEIVQLLINNGAQDKVSKLNYLNGSALHCAAEEGHADVVKVLLQCQKTCINTKRTGGATPLMLATQNKNSQIVKLLLDTKNIAAIFKKKLRGDTSTFVSSMVDTEVSNNQGRTPLHKAAELGNFEVGQLLIEAGANVNSGMGSKCGLTPLHLAARSGLKGTKIMKLLVARRANINARNAKGQTPYDLARCEVNRNILKKEDQKVMHSSFFIRIPKIRSVFLY